MQNDGCVIRAEGLGKRFGDRWAVRDLTLDVGRGEIFGFLGPNGAGKTTTVRMLAGMIAPSEGQAWISGVDLASGQEVIRSRIGLLTETPGLYERMTAAANLDFHARLHGLPAPKRRERVRTCLELLGLWDRRDDHVSGFSKGMKQRLAIARAVVHEPVAVFLDEPTSGLDPESARDVRAVIRDLREAGRAIFLCTHNLDEARRLCDKVAVFRGRVLRFGTPAELEREVLSHRVGIRMTGGGGQFLEVVRVLPMVRAADLTDDLLVVEVDSLERDVPPVVRTLVGAGADVQRVAEIDSALERAYLAIVGESQADREVQPA
ncbi:MAG: ABC transporter ATP-binding protein [Chloroflexi bacterium]|nr:ABC transporter ATP-binding protein [Chloroflexota bacterium]